MADSWDAIRDAFLKNDTVLKSMEERPADVRSSMHNAEVSMVSHAIGRRAANWARGQTLEEIAEKLKPYLQRMECTCACEVLDCGEPTHRAECDKHEIMEVLSRFTPGVLKG